MTTVAKSVYILQKYLRELTITIGQNEKACRHLNATLSIHKLMITEIQKSIFILPTNA